MLLLLSYVQFLPELVKWDHVIKCVNMPSVMHRLPCAVQFPLLVVTILFTHLIHPPKLYNIDYPSRNKPVEHLTFQTKRYQKCYHPLQSSYSSSFISSKRSKPILPSSSVIWSITSRLLSTRSTIIPSMVFSASKYQQFTAFS